MAETPASEKDICAKGQVLGGLGLGGAILLLGPKARLNVRL